MMIYRLWSTGVHADHVRRYRDFAQQRSLPMFRQQPGFRGVAFLQNGQEHLVLTCWSSMDDIHRLNNSESYLTTAQDLSASGVLSGGQRVEVLTEEIIVAPSVVI
jgi:heme-degrading monooxygenase HmoA